MKKHLLLIFLASFLAPLFCRAQADNTPNRLIVTDKGGVTSGYVIDYLEDLSFARVDGQVLAKVTVDEVDLTTLTLTVTRTPECVAYKLTVISSLVADQLGNDANAIRYINSLPAGDVPLLYEDFDRGTLSGIELNADSKYSVITIGIDSYGVESGVFRADFETPAPEVVGNPHVGMEILETTQTSFTVKFTPNQDVQSYWTVAGEEGTMQEQYEMFAPMFGFTNFSDMIRMWGIEYQGECENTWNDMAPNTNYEVFVAMTDANGNFAPYETYTVSTASKGGPGEASVNITLGSFEAADWDGEILPSQTITFTPNDQASCYRFSVYEAATYDANASEIKADLCSDPDQPYAYWFFYEEFTTDYQLNLNSPYVAIAAAKNINSEWGPVKELRFTTPAECPGYDGTRSPASKNLRKRATAPAKTQRGVIPAIKPARKLTLTH